MNKKDEALVDFIVNGTENGTLRWEPTANDNEFLTTLRGVLSVTILRPRGEGPDVLTLRNSNGQAVLELTAWDDGRITGIFPKARRNAFDVDTMIDSIINPPKDDDIPF